MHDWSSYEGRLLQGWRLETFLGIRNEKAFYVARHEQHDDARLIEIARDDSEQALASWKRAREIDKTNLLRVYDAGDAELEGDHVTFAAVDLPEDDLGEMIAKGPLDPEEARALLLAVATVLASLHKRGLHHGAIAPANIFIVKDEVRLSVDTIWPSGRLGEESDLRQFGASLVCALTGRTDAAAVDDPAILDAVAKLGPPFYDIAVGCLRGSPDRKWTAQRIVDALSGRWAPPPVTSPKESRGSKVRKAAAQQNFAHWLSGPQWPITGTAAVVAVIVLTYLFVHGPRPHKNAPPNSPPVQAMNGAPAPSATPVAPPPAPVEPQSESASRSIPQARSGSWAVVAAIYATYGAAQKRADRIRKQAPRLDPKVFPPSGQGKHYYIVLGSGLSQQQAERLRREARAHGAPPDTYITKFNAS